MRIAYTMGEAGGHSEDRSPLWLTGEPTRGAALRLLVLAPGHTYAFECDGEPVDVLVTYPDDLTSGGSLCTPLMEGADSRASRRRHELVLTGSVPALDTWTPVYLRAWTPMPQGTPEAEESAYRHFDPAQAFTIQVLFSAAELEHTSDEPPLDAAGLLRVPEIRARAGARTPAGP